MDYIVIPSSSKSETAFFLDLLKKMRKEATTLSSEEMEDYAFGLAMKAAENSGRGSLSKVKKHLAKISSRK
jgi:hypothetical protein